MANQAQKGGDSMIGVAYRRAPRYVLAPDSTTRRYLCLSPSGPVHLSCLTDVARFITRESVNASRHFMGNPVQLKHEKPLATR
jgi:hypothetical protein